MRIIASLLLSEDKIVQTYGFSDCSIIGSPIVTTKHLEQWGIDEFLIIQKDNSYIHLVENLRAIVSKTSTPITVCGGLDTIEKCSKLIQSGADRICIQSLIFQDFDAIKSLAEAYGGQSITVKFDINPAKKQLRSFNQMPYQHFIDAFQSLQENMVSLDITDLLFYDINADGNEKTPDFSLLNDLNLQSFSVILGGGLNQGNCKKYYQKFVNQVNDLSLSFSNCLYQHELESKQIIQALGNTFSQHRFYQQL